MVRLAAKIMLVSYQHSLFLPTPVSPKALGCSAAKITAGEIAKTKNNGSMFRGNGWIGVNLPFLFDGAVGTQSCQHEGRTN
jgi:hypothetical protein